MAFARKYVKNIRKNGKDLSTNTERREDPIEGSGKAPKQSIGRRKGRKHQGT